MENSESRSVDKQQLKRARRTALVLASVIVFSLLTLVYAYIQKKEADKARSHAEVIMMQLKQTEQEAIQAKEEAEKQRMMAIAAQHHALEALEACQQHKRK